MQAAAKSGFDAIARDYDTLWTTTRIGMSQRLAVWERMDSLFQPGQFVLDVGCGTGADALHFELRGVHVYGIDSSASMVEMARTRGISAGLISIQELHQIPAQFDGAISNFGALNCVPSLDGAAASLAGKVRVGGYIALCFIGSFCAWETCYYLFRGQFRRAFRRFHRRRRSSLGIEVFYFSRQTILAAFRKKFRLVGTYGIGLFVPPSYVKALGDQTIVRLAAWDKRCAHWPLLRRLADHRLYIFERI
ncbi:MAG TPA: methyltransferase domain-containing protein [Bryobacteraceae bacterium]|nr:methyltransferase domain-containing protein [Bryobacteraceae bacterium]